MSQVFFIPDKNESKKQETMPFDPTQQELMRSLIDTNTRYP